MESKYRIYCETESTFIETWADNTPTECPNNAGHSIDGDSIVIVDDQSTFFGKSYNYIRDETESSITGTTLLQTKLSLDITDLEVGTYRFSYSFDWSYSNILSQFHAEILLDSTTIVDSILVEPKVNNEVYHESSFEIFETFSGSHTFDMVYGVTNIDYVAKISNAVMEFWRVE